MEKAELLRFGNTQLGEWVLLAGNPSEAGTQMRGRWMAKWMSLVSFFLVSERYSLLLSVRTRRKEGLRRE